jgi:hypothetical protein
MPRNVIFLVMYHGHELLDLINVHRTCALRCVVVNKCFWQRTDWTWSYEQKVRVGVLRGGVT